MEFKKEFDNVEAKDFDVQSNKQKLENFKQQIEEHNYKIVCSYVNELLPIFSEFPAVAAEIKQQFSNGYYVFVGYKGVSMDRAVRICQGDFNTEEPSSNARGSGFYTTPDFDTAVDFAKYAGRQFAAEQTAYNTLLTPRPPANKHNMREQADFEKACDKFGLRLKQFEFSKEWKKYGTIL